MGLAIIVDILNPEVIVLGSIYIRCKDIMEPVITEVIKTEALPRSLSQCKIVASSLGNNIGNYGAICAALYNAKVME